MTFHFITFTADSADERVLKIALYLAKLRAKVGCPVFFLFHSRGIIRYDTPTN